MVNSGAVVSTTSITCVWLVLLPQSSDTDHVRVTVYWLGQLPAAMLSSKFTETSWQLSLAVNTAASGSWHSAVASAGSASLNVGAVVSSMVMVCAADVMLPHSSVAVNVRVTV